MRVPALASSNPAAAVAPDSLKRAFADIRDGFSCIHVWPMLGWIEIRQRYRRSVLGPFWITISMAAMIGGMGPLYARLFGQEVSGYFAYLTVGIVAWMLISNLISEGCNAFISAEGYLKETKLPLTVYVLRVVWKNLIMFAHNFVIVVAVLLYYRPPLGWSLLLFPIALLVVSACGLWVGLLLGLLCARFRDIPPTVTSLIQVVFFLTPVMWKPEMLREQAWVVYLNPIFHFIEILRTPLTGSPVPLLSWGAALGITLSVFVVAMGFFARFRGRIAYWV